MKLVIASPHCCKLDLIDIQYKSINKYVKDESIEYVIFNDGGDTGKINNFGNKNIRQEITDRCKELNIKCVEVPQTLHDNRNLIFPETQNIKSQHVSARASVVIQYIYNYYKNENIILMIIESDMFFIKNINIKEFLGNDVYVYLGQQKKNNNVIISYMWIGILIFNMELLENKDIINFDCGEIDGVNTDSGGFTHLFREKNKQNNKSVLYKNIQNINTVNRYLYSDNFIKLLENINKFYDDKGIFGETYLNDCIFHIRTYGSSWNYSSSFFKDYFEKNTDKNFNDSSWEFKTVIWKNYCDILSDIFKEYNHNI